MDRVGPRPAAEKRDRRLGKNETHRANAMTPREQNPLEHAATNDAPPGEREQAAMGSSKAL